ncbi:PREDICTED: uncharacterized protein LOC106314513 [Brassica oleracea var. oleracea]|uniref:uncharacterized protein LOC106314513 n=1 Tax=Brassica oleracea var. oleracea TaxID=109376 RepID=UPI0006A750C4|nr:PREDICTED: uncharacterized protein LOC106314513 [Brassica oleracea var. oleracea]
MAVENPVMQRMLSERRAALGLPVRDPHESDPTRQQPSNPADYFEDMPENGFTRTPAEDTYIRGRAPAGKSISYHTDDLKLFAALKNALHADEYEELKESKLGMFIKFKELDFGWASSLNCDYNEDLENPRCEVTKEMDAFWDMLGVDVDAGPTTEHIIAAFGRCEEWSQDDSMRLGYLAIFTGFIEGRKYSTATRASLPRLVMYLEKFENCLWVRVAFKVLMESLKGKDLQLHSYTADGFIQVLQVWAYYALPEFGASYGNPKPNRLSPLLLAYKGGKGCKGFKEAISTHTSVINFVQKDFGEMFPRWDFDVEDSAAENIIKVMFNAKSRWKWTMDCWEVTGTKPSVKKEVSAAETESGVKEESGRPKKKARKEIPLRHVQRLLKWLLQRLVQRLLRLLVG